MMLLRKKRRHQSANAFTLLEVLLASMVGAMILTAILGVFSGFLRLRDKITDRTREMQLRFRVSEVMRNDLQGAIVSGGALGSALEATTRGPESSRFNGYLRFTSSTGVPSTEQMQGDVQEVAYYITEDETRADGQTGKLVRAITRNLLGSTREVTRVETLLSGVSAMETSFSDGSTWMPTWNHTPTSETLPQAVRVLITQVPLSEKAPVLPPLEVLVPWSAQPLTTGTSALATEVATATETPTEDAGEADDFIPEQQDGEIAGEPGEMVGEEEGEEAPAEGQTP